MPSRTPRTAKSTGTDVMHTPCLLITNRHALSALTALAHFAGKPISVSNSKAPSEAVCETGQDGKKGERGEREDRERQGERGMGDVFFSRLPCSLLARALNQVLNPFY